MYKALSVFIPKCSELIRTDDERAVVMAGLDAYAELLKELKGDCFVGEGHREAIMNCVVDVMTSKVSKLHWMPINSIFLPCINVNFRYGSIHTSASAMADKLCKSVYFYDLFRRLHQKLCCNRFNSVIFPPCFSV